MKNYFAKLGLVSLSVAPLLASAQVGKAFDTLNTVITKLGETVKALIPIVFGLAILAFFWGIFRYVFAHSQDDKKNGRNIMLWSLIAVFIMASLYGIITLTQTSLGITPGGGTLEPVKIQ